MTTLKTYQKKKQSAFELCSQVLITELDGLKILEESLHDVLRKPIEDAADC